MTVVCSQCNLNPYRNMHQYVLLFLVSLQLTIFPKRKNNMHLCKINGFSKYYKSFKAVALRYGRSLS